MPQRDLAQTYHSFEKNPIHVNARIAIGATGAPTVQGWNWANPGGAWVTKTSANGILSVARVSAGLYTVTFGPKNLGVGSDNYVRLLSVIPSFNTQAVGAAVLPAAPISATVTDSVATGSLQVQFFNLSGVATDPASGEIVNLDIAFGQSTAP